MSAIRIPWDAGTKVFDRDQLATAILVRLEYEGDGTSYRVTQATSRALSVDHGFGLCDATVLAMAARICIEQGIDP